MLAARATLGLQNPAHNIPAANKATRAENVAFMRLLLIWIWPSLLCLKSLSSIMPRKHGSATSPQASDPDRGEGWDGHRETAYSACEMAVYWNAVGHARYRRSGVWPPSG